MLMSRDCVALLPGDRSSSSTKSNSSSSRALRSGGGSISVSESQESHGRSATGGVVVK